MWGVQKKFFSPTFKTVAPPLHPTNSVKALKARIKTFKKMYDIRYTPGGLINSKFNIITNGHQSTQ